MALKQYKPNTPGQRGLVLVDKSDLYKGKPEKKLTEGISKNGGRNHSGKITMWQRGGGACAAECRVHHYGASEEGSAGADPHGRGPRRPG